MTMATPNQTSGDDTYGSALQRVMHECLTPILVEIADKRPADPIEYLAHSLYKFREKEDQELNTASNYATPPDTMSSNIKYKHTGKSQGNKLRQDFLSKGLIVENSPSKAEDFIEEDSFETVVDISNKLVHESCMSVMKQIGDIFDDDDLS